MLQKTQLYSWTPPQSSPLMQTWSTPIEEDNLSLLTMSSIMAQCTSLPEERILPLKITARDHVVLEKMAKELPNVSSTSDPVFRQAMKLIDRSREMDQQTWAQQFPDISDARIGRIVDFYLQLYDVKDIFLADGLDYLSRLRPGLTANQGYEKARVISLEREIFFKLSQKNQTLSTEEKLTPLGALSLAWWLHREGQPKLAELSAVIYRPENKEIRIQAAILYNHSHYGNRYGEIAAVSTADFNDWGINQMDAPELPISRAVSALRVIHEGMDAPPSILQSSGGYLANRFAPKNAQGRYLKIQSLSLEELMSIGSGETDFSQQDCTQIFDSQSAVGSLAFSLRATLKLHYQLQGNTLDELEDKNTEQLYDLLNKEEQQLHQVGGAHYSPMAIFLSHFSQSNEVEFLTLEQTASIFQDIAESINVSRLPKLAQPTFNIMQQIAANIISNTAIDIEHLRFELELKILATLFEPNHPLYKLAHHGRYKTEQEKIERQLDYLDMRLAYRHPPALFDEDQAIKEILRENGVKNIETSRRYTYRQDPRHGYPQKENDSPVDEFKRRRDASNHFVANMSMLGKNDRLINVFDTLEAKKNEYNTKIKSHPAILAQAMNILIDEGQRPEGSALQDKINALAKDYRPEPENSRFWGNAWSSLEKHWVCKLPGPNPMCTIARVEGPRYRNEKKNMAAGMSGMLMETSQLKGMERGVKLIENPPQGIKPSGALAATPQPAIASRLPVGEGEMILPGTQIKAQRIELADPQTPDGVREAWVRQGGSGVYWEVDSVTGKYLGVVLKHGPTFIQQGRLPGGGPSFSKTSNPEFNPVIKLGKKIGSGLMGDVYIDANNPGFVLKRLPKRNRELINEVFAQGVELFNRYYGEGAAEIVEQNNQSYIRMYRVPGKTLKEINSKIFQKDARERFLRMMDDLGHYNIVHNDLNINNVLYDKKTNTFYPIDFDDTEEGYFSARDPNNDTQFVGKGMQVEDILEHIDMYTRN
ncbi:OspG family effector kinase [Yersinia aleksiciae]|uniref:OspG family effector kinase n=1 Tax=Yersinia aleksiciae TaxID=263819 RepID=UPI0011AAF7FB|nr:serine/threonine-protein kinase [Yersinia aleksiciae]